MIVLTRLNGPTFGLNPDLIERAEANPDTVITLVGGVKYVISETLDELVERIRDYRGQIIASAQSVEHLASPPERRLHPVDAHRQNGI